MSLVPERAPAAAPAAEAAAPLQEVPSSSTTGAASCSCGRIESATWHGRRMFRRGAAAARRGYTVSVPHH